MKKYIILILFILFSCQVEEEIEEDLCEEINTAWESMVGFDYVFGGRSFSHGGFDCSGAVYKSLKLMGRPITYTTSRKYYIIINSNPVHWTEAECGYLIWWTFTPNRPYGHIGMHAEEFKVWNSSASTGPTKIEMKKGIYWDSHFEASKKLF